MEEPGIAQNQRLTEDGLLQAAQKGNSGPLQDGSTSSSGGRFCDTSGIMTIGVGLSSGNGPDRPSAAIGPWTPLLSGQHAPVSHGAHGRSPVVEPQRAPRRWGCAVCLDEGTLHFAASNRPDRQSAIPSAGPSG